MKIRKLAKSEIPPALREIPQPPDDLWIIGDLPNKDLIHLCVVGSRKNTSYGREACEKILEGLKGYPIVIVSGFAVGIDTIAHQSALSIGLPTMVFPGSGLSLDAMYPKVNVKLIEKIIRGGGCLVSEFEPDFKATIWGFPMRNRLMAGISKATLVIEATEKSGTLITARLALEYNKDLLVVPGSIFQNSSNGTNNLIKMGATPITCSDDLLEALGFEQQCDEEKQKRLFADLSPEETKIVGILREPTPRDQLIRALQMSTKEANALLSIMEIKKIIKEEMGEIRLA